MVKKRRRYKKKYNTKNRLILSLCLLIGLGVYSVLEIKYEIFSYENIQSYIDSSSNTITYVYDIDIEELEYNGVPYVIVDDNTPSFSEDEITLIEYEYYSELDYLGRAGVVIACVGEDLLPTEERGSISSYYPSGWIQVQYDSVDGGYLYNRSHLLGYQLGGDDTLINLITGTRYFNVEGMLPFENEIASFVDDTGYHVMYRITPYYIDDNLLSSGVQLEAYSVEDEGEGLSFNVFCFNVQPDIYIDYSDGESYFLQ